MAEPGAAGPTRDVANEGRLRAARREAPTDDSSQPGPSENDEVAPQARGSRTERSSDEAAAQNIQRRGGQGWLGRKATSMLMAGGMALGSPAASAQSTQDQQGEVQGGARGDDQTVSATARQQRLENQLNNARRSSWKAKDAVNAAQGAMSMAKVATMPARATPQGAAVGAGLDAAGGGVKGAMMAAKALQSGGVDKSEVQKTFGRGCVKMLWQNLWITFGHTSWFLVIIFYASSQSRYVRKFFPRIGEEWFPPDLIKKMPKGVMVPLQLAETVGLAFVFFWVLLLDLTCLGLWALMLGLIFTAAGIV